MRKEFLLYMLLWLSMTAVADEPVSNLVISLRNGDKVAIALADYPKITFNGTEMVITSSRMQVNYDLDHIKTYTFTGLPTTGIIDIQSNESLFKLQGESILFPALKSNSIIKIYSANGKLVFNQTVHQEGEYALPISTLHTGFYIISINGLTYKFMKR